MMDYTNASTIYLSSSAGDDRYSGFSATPNGRGDGPVRSLRRLKELLSGLRVGGLHQPITVRVMGDYYLTEPLSLGLNAATVGDPTAAVCNVTFESAPGTRGRFIGGRRLSGFARDVFRGVPCLSLHIPEVENGSWHFTDLYVGGKRASLSRYPKEGTLRAVTTEFPDTAKLGEGSRWFVAHKEDLAGIEGVEDAIVSFYHFWIDEHSPVESYDRETGKLTMAYRSRFRITANYERNSTSELYYYLENVPAAFGAPNEWYLDVPRGMLYYVPEEDVEPEDFEAFAPTEKQIVMIEGTPECHVRGIRFRDLDFFCSRGDYASRSVDPSGIVQGEPRASDSQSAALAYGALRFRYADHCAIENCRITCTGLHGVEILGGCEGIRIENTLMESLGGGGVKIYGGRAEEASTEKTAHCAVRGCTIRHIGRRYAASCGVLVCHSSYNDIADNDISYTDYTGISVGWIWGYAPSSTYGNLIRRNHVHHIGVGLLSDMAAIYLLGTQEGTVVSDNYVHDVRSSHYGGHGIYTDEGSSYIVIERNTVVNCRDNCFYQHYGRQNIVRDNLFAFGDRGVVAYGRLEPHIGAILENNILISGGEPFYHSYSGNGVSLPSIKSAGNRLYEASGKEPAMFLAHRDGAIHPVTLAEWQEEYGKDVGSTVGLPEGITVDFENRMVVVK